MRRARVVVPLAAVAAIALAGGGYALAAGGLSDVTLHACLNGGKLNNVQVTGQPGCSSSATPVQWAGQAVTGSPAPSPTPTTPSPTPTSPSPSPTGAACVKTLGQNCGPYSYQQIPMSNGFDTYVSNQNVGANPGTTATVNAAGPGDWSVTANAVPYGYGGVQLFPDVQQLANDWNGSGWGSGSSDTPLSALSALTINYSESVSQRDANTSFEFAPDIWTEEYPSDVMFWADTHGRCNNGAYGGTILGTATFGGQTWTVNRYGGAGAEIIFVLDSNPATPDSCAQQTSGTVDIKAGFDWLIANGYLTGATFTQLNAGWEITSADNTTFTVSSYSITATPS